MEKRLIAAAAAVLACLLVFCTVTARQNFEENLPHVQARQITVEDGSVLLPGSACFPKGSDSVCVYALVLQPGPFGQDRYFLREVPVTARQQSNGLCLLRGIYDRTAWYVTATDRALSDGAEVIWQK